MTHWLGMQALIPVVDQELITGTDDAHLQVVADLTEPDLVAGDVRGKLGNIGVAGSGVVLGDLVTPPTSLQQISVPPRTAN